jgi:hypothetical protein
LKTKQKRPEPLRFILLVPHRDSGRILETYRHRLFAGGLAGAFSFPVAVPLARTARPLDREELRTLAGELRSLSLQKEGDGKFRAARTGVVPCEPGGFSFFGPLLEPGPSGDGASLPSLAGEKILLRFPALCLCAALLGEREGPPGGAEELDLSFRAAMVANMSIRPLSSGEAGYSFMWKIGRPAWLPAYKEPKG